MPDDLTRREFVKLGVTGAAALAMGPGLASAAPPMPERPLGRTGHMVRLFSLGGPSLDRAGRQARRLDRDHQPRDSTSA